MAFVVFGATGNVGSHVLQGLLDADPSALDGATIRVVSRTPEALRLETRGAQNVEVVQGELSVAVRAGEAGRNPQGGAAGVLLPTSGSFIC